MWLYLIQYCTDVFEMTCTSKSQIISDLNASTSHCFKQARGEQRKKYMQSVPGFCSGRFLTEEDAVILSRLQFMQSALDWGADEASKLISETNSHNQKKGTCFCLVLMFIY